MADPEPQFWGDSYSTFEQSGLSVALSDWNNTTSSSQFHIAGPGSVIGGQTITIANINDVVSLFAVFLNGKADATIKEKNALGASIGATTGAKLSLKSVAYTDPDGWTVTNLAQRENKWSIRVQDIVTKEFYSYTIPCANLAILQAGSEVLPADIAANFQAFLDGPVVETKHLPVVVSNRGNRLKYVTSTYIGVRYKR